MTTFTDYTKSLQAGYTKGFCSLFFKDADESVIEAWDRAFVCNSKDDGWFRRNEGNGDGYGLAMVWMEKTGRKLKAAGDFQMFQVKVTYQSWEDEFKFETDTMRLAVHKDFTFSQVQQYCLENSHNWRA